MFCLVVECVRDRADFWVRQQRIQAAQSKKVAERERLEEKEAAMKDGVVPS
jgi:hypothetical protein